MAESDNGDGNKSDDHADAGDHGWPNATDRIDGDRYHHRDHTRDRDHDDNLALGDAEHESVETRDPAHSNSDAPPDLSTGPLASEQEREGEGGGQHPAEDRHEGSRRRVPPPKDSTDEVACTDQDRSNHSESDGAGHATSI